MSLVWRGLSCVDGCGVGVWCWKRTPDDSVGGSVPCVIFG